MPVIIMAAAFRTAQLSTIDTERPTSSLLRSSSATVESGKASSSRTLQLREDREDAIATVARS